MNTGQVWSGVKDLGSVVGLLTGAFVLIDRLGRGRPYAAWVRMSHGNATLEFINTSDRYVYLHRIVCWPPRARASRFEDSAETIADHWNVERTVVLAPRGTCTTVVTWSRDLPPRGVTLVIVRWQRAGAIFAIPLVKFAAWRSLLKFQERNVKI